MKFSRIPIALASCALVGAAFTAPATAGPLGTGSGPAVVEGSTGPEALATDLALVAKSRGWTVEQAAAQHAVAEAFGKVQQEISVKRQDAYAGAKLSETPGGAPTLYVKGKADDDLLARVRASGVAVEIADNRPHSWLELEERSIRLNHRLVGIGFQDVVTSFDETTSTVEAVATRRPNLPAQAQQVLSRLSADEARGVRLALIDDDVASDEQAFGGMSVQDDGVFECTSGWAVQNGSGTTGVTTAGHCDGINQIVDPAVGTHAVVHQAEHRGEWGDVEWKTSAVAEPDDFYASATEVRDVAAVEPRASITVGEAVCVYGRSSNSRDCGDTVFRTSISCTNSGVFNDRLVAMNAKNTTIGGDSGGGWSFNFTAFGSHKGGCTVDGSVRNVFSVADLYDEALGVSVRTS
ncbi:hypothetical protein G7043_42450 [Lentzea sp. NEAU-D13]|uniref:Streptogrisin C n=1 Tax=Lentzea alba TaxID=2714351 RepID=A0A7C9VYY9_9PSEU|nr:hypothetical protein [Lentzea alba]NGY65575.1 hypothetical protein [Lentzea alba]